MDIAGLAATLTDALGSFDPEAHSAAECARLAERLASTGKACSAASLLAASRAATLGAHRDLGFADPASWLARQAGTTTHQAKEALGTAKSLDSLPGTKEALLAGEISLPQAQEIARAEEETPGQEAELLQVARERDLTKLRSEVRDRRFASTPVDRLHEEQLAARRFRSWRDSLGMVRIDAALPPETGVPLVNRVETIARRLWRACKGEGAWNQQRFEQIAADALVETTGGDGDGSADQRSTGRYSTELVIVCDLFAWRRGYAHEDERCHIIGGGPIPVDLAKELSEDAFLKVVLHDGKAIQLVSHPGRRYTAHLRTALDLGPVPAFAGRRCQDCGRRYGLEYDHVDPVAHTGPSEYDNIESRCYPCHAAKTERDRSAGLLGRRAQARSPGSGRKPKRSSKRRAPLDGAGI